jgi:hypothetical protein
MKECANELGSTVKQIQYAVCITRICINKNGQKPHLLEEAPKEITVTIKDFLSRHSYVKRYMPIHCNYRIGFTVAGILQGSQIIMFQIELENSLLII